MGSALRKALGDIRQAERVACAVLATEYPLGTWVRYRHGTTWRRGLIDMHGVGLRVRVLHRGSGARVWVGAERLEHDD